MINPEAKKILEDTYRILEDRGWCQGAMSQPDGKVCLEGAFRTAAGIDLGTGTLYDTPYFEAWGAVRAAVREETSPDILPPFRWNDAPERTIEDVKLVLKRAIES